MKKSGVLNRHLAAALAQLGHTDEVVVCDAGLPIPHGTDGPTVVDLSLTWNIPRFSTVVEVVLAELEIEGATAASELPEVSPEVAKWLDSRLATLDLVPHDELKKRTRTSRLIIRTGEATPYANVILRCGVPF